MPMRHLSMRFGQDMTRAQVGERLGLSRRHISRLRTRILVILDGRDRSRPPPFDVRSVCRATCPARCAVRVRRRRG
ncbi:hypothetical protein B4N89_36985 [Embleya scabrispora]|uniref:RNA polymerase sigma-70 region 4 domain-containing protein n=1 Tax=Embleya scabrispora TaxID=159449 RepID=A0A1T3NM95_9ACTN|nr:hypothetical protein B4N89_36985 [Embleya scabrispora]